MSLEQIVIIEGDAFPEPGLTLKDRNTGERNDPDTWEPIDVSDANTSVRVDFREPGDTTIVATVTCTKVSNGTYGEVFFAFPSAIYNNVGKYEGEIVIDRNGATETVDEKLNVKVKARGL